MDKIKEITGMDANTVYTIVVSIILGFVIPALSKVFNRNEENWWRIQVKFESDLFFAYVMLCSLIEVVVTFYLGLKIKELLLSFLNSGWNYALSFVLFLVSTYVLFKLHYRIFFIRKRLVGINIFIRILCFIPVLLINLVMWLFYLNIMHEWIKSIISITFIITEIIGLIYFMGRYLTYEYSFANIHLKNGTVISEIDIDKIKRKAKWIIIEKSKSEIRVKLEEFNRIDYYGEQKVKLIDNWAHTILTKFYRSS
jgi:hypothetical protein